MSRDRAAVAAAIAMHPLILSDQSHMPYIPTVAGWTGSLLRDAGLWDWAAPADRGERTAASREVTKPRRLVHQIGAEGEMVHSHLDTRIKNHSDGEAVSLLRETTTAGIKKPVYIF